MITIDGFTSKPFVLEIVKVALSFFLIKKYQTANIGIKTNNHKNCGCKNSKFLKHTYGFMDTEFNNSIH